MNRATTAATSTGIGHGERVDELTAELLERLYTNTVGQIQATIVSGGNVRLSGVQLIPDAYAALAEINERVGLNWADAINAAIIAFNEIAKVAEAQGTPLGTAP